MSDLPNTPQTMHSTQADTTALAEDANGCAVHDCAIIGAGIAGSYLAAKLSALGYHCAVYDKSRGSGGRASSKRLPEGGSCDQGAPFFELEHPALACEKSRLMAADVIRPLTAGDELFTAIPKMSALTRFWLAPQEGQGDISFYTSMRIHHIRRWMGVWHLLDEKYQTVGKATQLVITAPASQAAMLLTSPHVPSSMLLKAHRASRACLPQWVMRFNAELDADGISIDCDHDVIERLVCDGIKPERGHNKNCWVAHTRPEWSILNTDTAPEQVAETIEVAVRDLFPATSTFTASAPHRWLLGRHKPQLLADVDAQSKAEMADVLNDSEAPDCCWDADSALGLAGDWLSSGDIQGAMLSALRLSQIMYPDSGQN
ncbi:MAG: NAD(P)/FAD-dependent oxidoreductase [Pontibacterium sp.]